MIHAGVSGQGFASFRAVSFVAFGTTGNGAFCESVTIHELQKAMLSYAAFGLRLPLVYGPGGKRESRVFDGAEDERWAILSNHFLSRVCF